jgi:hypothetical protein
MIPCLCGAPRLQQKMKPQGADFKAELRQFLWVTIAAGAPEPL